MLHFMNILAVEHNSVGMYAALQGPWNHARLSTNSHTQSPFPSTPSDLPRQDHELSLLTPAIPIPIPFSTSIRLDSSKHMHALVHTLYSAFDVTGHQWITLWVSVGLSVGLRRSEIKADNPFTMVLWPGFNPGLIYNWDYMWCITTIFLF